MTKNDLLLAAYEALRAGKLSGENFQKLVELLDKNAAREAIALAIRLRVVTPPKNGDR